MTSLRLVRTGSIGNISGCAAGPTVFYVCGRTPLSEGNRKTAVGGKGKALMN